MMTIVRIYDGDARLLGYLCPGQACVTEPFPPHGLTIRCIDSRSHSEIVERDGCLYARMAEFVVHRTVLKGYPMSAGEVVLTSLIMPAPFDELWDWPGFVRFPGWN